MTTLSPDQARTAVIGAIASVAPDVESELDTVDPACDLFEELQLDSMDHLNVMTALARSTGVEIPERDYPGLRTIDALTAHVAAGTGGG